MNRIEECFRTLREQGRKGLIPYITAGDPVPEVTVPTMHALVGAGADLLELGVPFSDPMADGPVIQAACERALRHHVSLHRVLDMVRDFRRQDRDTPVILMGYLNPIEAWGYADFARAAGEAGVDAVLTVDLPPEEADEFRRVLRAAGLDVIFLLAPTSGPDRIRMLASSASGFLYYVSFAGVTGANRLNIDSVATSLAEIRKHTSLPVGVGFGIRDPESAARVAALADAVVIGSALVGKMAELEDRPESIPSVLATAVAAMRQAIDEGAPALAGAR
jgi:tryptophan synthase alpha chain